MRLIDADKLVPDTEYDDYGDGEGPEYLSYSSRLVLRELGGKELKIRTEFIKRNNGMIFWLPTIAYQNHDKYRVPEWGKSFLTFTWLKWQLNIVFDRRLDEVNRDN